MTRNVFHIKITEGTDYTQSFLYVDPVLHLPIDLTGYIARLRVKQGNTGGYDGYSNPDVILEIPTAGGSITLGGTAGTITLNIPASLTMNPIWINGVYSLDIMSPAGKITQFANGFFTIIPDANSAWQT